MVLWLCIQLKLANTTKERYYMAFSEEELETLPPFESAKDAQNGMKPEDEAFEKSLKSVYAPPLDGG